MKDWDFGWFGKGLSGYVHYKQAFDRSFPPEKRTSRPKKAEPSSHPQKASEDHPDKKGKNPRAGSQAGLWLLVLAVAVLWYLVLLVQPR